MYSKNNQQLIIKYKKQGKKRFMHGNRGRLPASAVPLDIKNKIISLYINDFSGTNFTHFCEIVESDFRIKISDTTLNNWMKAEEVLSPKYLMNRMNIQDVLNQNMQVR